MNILAELTSWRVSLQAFSHGLGQPGAAMPPHLFRLCVWPLVVGESGAAIRQQIRTDRCSLPTRGRCEGTTASARTAHTELQAALTSRELAKAAVVELSKRQARPPGCRFAGWLVSLLPVHAPSPGFQCWPAMLPGLRRLACARVPNGADAYFQRWFVGSHTGGLGSRARARARARRHGTAERSAPRAPDCVCEPCARHSNQR